MCVIAVSKAGKRQPTETELRAMWARNPDGAGYMFARDGSVIIHKGFMILSDFINAVRSEKFAAADSVVYHFRISTQAGVNAIMTHPFPITDNPEYFEYLDLICPLGVAHNGIIPLTTDPEEKKYSDTALFIMRCLSRIIKESKDINNVFIQKMIKNLGGFSKFAFLEGTGNITTIGDFTDSNGILLSNTYHIDPPESKWTKFIKHYANNF